MQGDFRLSSWLVQPSLNTVSRDGTTVQLEPKVMAVLLCLAESPGEPVPKEKILQTVWPDTFVGEGVLTRSIFELRRVFEDEAKEPRVIQTIAKRGYRLLAPVDKMDGKGVSREKPPDAPAVTVSTRLSPHRWRWAGIIAGTTLLCGVAALAPSTIRGRVLGHSAKTAIHSLAVLPLQNLSGDPSQDYFADAMTEELITELSRVSALKVISRTSVMRYKKTDKSLPQIAKELNVDAIVEGSILRSGNRVRITTQLIYASNDANLWAQTYDRDLQDVLTLQSAVASAVADEVKVNLTPQERVHIASARKVDPKALDDCLAGRYHLAQMNYYAFRPGMDTSFRKEQASALHDFQQAAQEDPNYASAYVGVADSLLGSYSLTPQGLRDAKQAVERALRIDESLVAAHVTKAFIQMNFDWDWTGAEKELRRAIELNPSSAFGHDEYGFLLDAMGRSDEAMQQHEKAQELDPATDHLGVELYFRRKWNLERDLAMHHWYVNGPDNSLYYRAIVYERLGMEKEAIAEWIKVARCFGFEDLARILEQSYPRSGYKGALRELVRGMESDARKEYFAPWMVAHFHGELNDRDRAFFWLEKCYQVHDGELMFLKVDPFWSDNLRADPRFADLVHRLGLPEDEPRNSASVQAE